MLLDEIHEYNADGFYDRLLCMSAKPSIKVDVVNPMTHFYEDSDSVTIPPSLLDQFNKIGMPRPISEEMKLVYPTAKDIERGFSYIDGLVDALIWKIGSMLEEVTDDAACSESNEY